MKPQPGSMKQHEIDRRLLLDATPRTTAASLARMLRGAGLDEKQLALAGAYISGMLRESERQGARIEQDRMHETTAKIFEALGYDLSDIEHAHCCH